MSVTPEDQRQYNFSQAVISWELYKMHAEGGYQNSRVSFGNHVLIMNLAVADLIMGIF